MKIHVLLSPLNVDELYFAKKTTVVIDVLRASSTIVTALENGAREIVPVGTIEFAMKVSGNAFGGQTILGGERNTKKIEGFTLGNSPLEYTSDAIQGKSIILYTTNGSKAIVKAKFSENLFIATFNNINTITKHLIKLNLDIQILCAGASGMFCIEDTVCAGKLIEEIKKEKENIELSDAAKASLSLANSFGENINKMLHECEHGKLLIENGFENDINSISKVGIFNVIPYYNSGVIKKMVFSDEESKSVKDN